MKKSTVIFSLALAGVLLTGCTGGTPSGGSEQNNTPAGGVTEEQSAPTAEAAPTEQGAAPEETEQGASPEESKQTEQSAPPEEEGGLPFPLYALNGDTVKPEEITRISPRGEEPLTAAELTADNWYYIECDGFAYIAEPTLHYNSIENPELYDEESWRFEGVPNCAKLDYKRYKTGDTWGDLTISFASTGFSYENAETFYDFGDGNIVRGSELGQDEIYFDGCRVSFDGSIELTGWLALAPEDEGYTSRDDLIFVPDNESCVLPVVYFDFDTNDGIVTRYFVGRPAGIGCVNDYPAIEFGNAGMEEYADIDFRGVPYADEGYAKVRITITDISMRSMVSWLSHINAKVTDLEVIG